MRAHLGCGFIVAFALCGSLSPLSAQGVFAGRWTIQSGQIAPWVPDSAKKNFVPTARLLKSTISFGRKGVVAPPPLNCREAEFAVVDAPLENLFEGGLTDPQAQAAALGFTGSIVKTLVPGCEIEYHLVDKHTALFALDNIIYTMTR